MRIISLLPSTTEIICDLGLGSELVGVTAECNWPQHVQDGREIVVRSFADPALTPGQIDEFVRQQLDAGLDLYTLDDEALQRCDPDLIVSQDLCRVCAVASGDVEAATARLNCRAEILQIDPQNLSDVLESIVTIANAAGVADRGLEFVASLRSRLNNVLEAVQGCPRRRVFVLEWIDPPFGAGHWVPDLVVAAGGEPVLSHPGDRSLQTTWESITQAQPEVVIVAPCGFGLEQASDQARLVLDLVPETAEVWAIDADAVMVRPGPRLVDGVEALASLLHGVGKLPTILVNRIR
ncbi:MAG TPA: ABC transporter substrate-binding protein [Acidimicrobiales bacterium]|nr:ABC transporter substrate-binding protein [Acidimicrobiales bacterium]